MPTSCAVTFDVLRVMAAGEALDVSVRELAEVCRLSYGATWRALRRLRGANLLYWRPGTVAGTPSTIELNWDRPRRASSPQKADPPTRDVRSNPDGADEMQHTAPLSRARYPYPQGVDLSHTGASAPVAPTPDHSKAVRWAMARVRAEVRRWPISWERRNRILRGCAVALSRALQRGAVVPGKELGRTVAGLLHRLQLAEEISGDLRHAISFATWATREASTAASTARRAIREAVSATLHHHRRQVTLTPGGIGYEKGNGRRAGEPQCAAAPLGVDVAGPGGRGRGHQQSEGA